MHNESSHIEDKHLNSNTAGLLFRLVSIQELGEILGYGDVRSVKSWCKESGIPLFRLGKKTYTDSKLLDQHLAELLDKNQVSESELNFSITTELTARNMSEAARKFLSKK